MFTDNIINEQCMHLIFLLIGNYFGSCKWHPRLCYAKSCSRVSNMSFRDCLVFADCAEGYSRSRNLQSQ